MWQDFLSFPACGLNGGALELFAAEALQGGRRSTTNRH
jgi:hypothetical protein